MDRGRRNSGVSHSHGHLVQGLDKIPGGVEPGDGRTLVGVHEELALLVALSAQRSGQV